ncbi:glycosyltransferase family 2 protein [Sphingomonas sp. CFBP 13603]|uniref:glycosyltransferase family 2 protein n=1 Tax=Sphingomonas sp. CFBP 13603 TaxID=2774040 RepID=UPI001865C632|nr:glycosyltransferase family 2 protein [Sphingomonas sp. CFBP 13603]MBE2992974.1 glycosyltransferase family 2 protein [Sphingomonas sp. CFBP 13603]
MNVLVTITYNALGHDILPAFLDCIRAQRDTDFTLLVIDNASTDGTPDYLRSLALPNLRLILNDENIGFGRACNQGIAVARELGATHVTFINNDVEFGPDLIGGMVASLEASGAAGLSPLITLFDQPERLWFATGSYRWNRGMIPYHDLIGDLVTDLPASLDIRATDFAPGCCLVFRLDTFETIPGFDDRFFVYWEDADLSMELKKRGLRIVTDTALECRHKVSVSTGGSFSDFSIFHFNRGHMLFVRKHFGSSALAFVLPVAFAKALLNVLRRRMKPSQLAVWRRGIASGLAS